jgi:hypothetical protein
MEKREGRVKNEWRRTVLFSKGKSKYKITACVAGRGSLAFAEGCT